jgi:hypothetical protein
MVENSDKHFNVDSYIDNAEKRIYTFDFQKEESLFEQIQFPRKSQFLFQDIINGKETVNKCLNKNLVFTYIEELPVHKTKYSQIAEDGRTIGCDLTSLHEAIVRSAPIFCNKNSLTIKLLGVYYPLFYEESEIKERVWYNWINENSELILKAHYYLQNMNKNRLRMRQDQFVTMKRFGENGRLGNQMFQYAVLKVYALKMGIRMKLPIRDNEEYRLSHAFNKTSLGVEQLNAQDITDMWFREKHFEYDPEIYTTGENMSVDIDGYFQSMKYIEGYEDIIRNTFVFHNGIQKNAEEFILRIRTNPGDDQIIGIHIRRGDYITNPFTQGEPVYAEITPSVPKLVQEFKNNWHSGVVCKFVVFSDEIEWCKEHFKDFENFYFSENQSDVEDMCRFSMCDHQIMSPSSFSWWSAFLNPNPKKVVYAPKPWFNSRGVLAHSNDKVELYCEGYRTFEPIHNSTKKSSDR